MDSWTLGDVDIEVATERHRIDILLIDNTDKCVCLIENKIGADEGPRQLRGYLETVELAYPQLRPLPIFLTPEGREPQAEEDAEHWVPFDYERIADLIDRALRRLNHRLRDRQLPRTIRTKLAEACFGHDR